MGEPRLVRLLPPVKAEVLEQHDARRPLRQDGADVVDADGRQRRERRRVVDRREPEVAVQNFRRPEIAGEVVAGVDLAPFLARVEPTPAGVPVLITSPGSRVNAFEAWETRAATS